MKDPYKEMAAKRRQRPRNQKIIFSDKNDKSDELNKFASPGGDLSIHPARLVEIKLSPNGALISVYVDGYSRISICPTDRVVLHDGYNRFVHDGATGFIKSD